MTRYIIDCETDGFLEVLTRIHCLVALNVDTGELHSDGPDTVEAGLRRLLGADELIGHNLIKFDLPAIQKVYPWFTPTARLTDTLVCTRLIWPDVKADDFRFLQKQPDFPKKLIGLHSLKAWGHRLGVLKGEYGETSGWSQWTPEMQAYCEQDVRVTAALYRKILSKQYSRQAIDLEHQFAGVIARMERAGFAFDVPAAVKLQGVLVKRREALRQQLLEAFPAYVQETTFIPKVNNSKRGYEKDVPFIKRTTVVVNPSSREQLAYALSRKYGWKPTEFGANGKPTLSDEILRTLEYPEVPMVRELYLVEKRLGQLAEGQAAWLKLERNGRIHGSVNTNGAVTGRCTHSAPNIAQVPSAKKDKVTGRLVYGAVSDYGTDCRALFYAG